MQFEIESNTRSFFSLKKLIFVFITLGILALLLGLLYIEKLNETPEFFPRELAITIPFGSTASETAQYLENAGVVRSATYLKYLLSTKYKDRHIQAGTYAFPEALTSEDVAWAITSGEHASPGVSVTFYEGVRGEHIAKILGDVFPDRRDEFDPEAFDEYIGFLFPDTYFVETDVTEAEIIERMRETFNEKTIPFKDAIENSDFTEEQIITLASIIEREANTKESMQTVSGILYNRLEIGMALQVDATFEYLLGKASDELTIDDLEIDSPYNTYTNRGLPPTPIANPGLDAIEAALFPEKNDFLYYITGNDGEFYYGLTFEDHKRNKELYLR